MLGEYWRHAALNAGQAVRDLRFFYYHPNADKVAAQGTFRHALASIRLRIGSFANNAFYTIWPPHLHHTKAELASMKQASVREWFLHGFMPWKYKVKTA